MRFHFLLKVVAVLLLVVLCAAAFQPSRSVAGEGTITPPYPTDSTPPAEGQSSSPWSDPLLGVGLGTLALIY
jgi:hypothetical protein